MSAVERIQAAIDKLEALRGRVGTSGAGMDDPRLAEALRLAIATWRSTIDAQLAILRDERSRLTHSCPHCTKPWTPALTLANAILGPDPH